MIDICITESADGAKIRFARDMAIVASLKATFPKARFVTGIDVHWFVPGTTAVKRAIKWRDEATAQRATLVTLQMRRSELAGTCATATGEMEATFHFPYDPKVVAIVKALPNAIFNGPTKSWVVRPSDASEVDAVIACAKAITEMRRSIAAADAQAEAEKRARVARRATVKVGSVAVGGLARGGRGVILVEELGAVFYQDGISVQYAYGELAAGRVHGDAFAAYEWREGEGPTSEKARELEQSAERGLERKRAAAGV